MQDTVQTIRKLTAAKNVNIGRVRNNSEAHYIARLRAQEWQRKSANVIVGMLATAETIATDGMSAAPDMPAI